MDRDVLSRYAVFRIGVWSEATTLDKVCATGGAGVNWRQILAPYRQVRRRGTFAWGDEASRRGTCDRGIWTKPLAFAADAEGYINIMVWGFNGRFAISSPSGHANSQFC
jgi:hypothetical protein